MRSLIVAGLALLVWFAAPAEAAQLRYRYVPVDAQGNTSMKPVPASAAPGERVSLFRGVEPACHPPRPTCLVTFRHSCTDQPVMVPLALPTGTPVIEHVRNRVIYNYGSWTVSVLFLPDGSVEVVYSSGLFRGI